MKKKYLPWMVSVAVFLSIGVTVCLQFFSPVTESDGAYINIDDNDTMDSVLTKYAEVSGGRHVTVFKWTAFVLGYDKKIRTGHYEISSHEGLLSLVRKLRSGMQTPIKLTVPSVRTVERLAAELGERLMIDSTAIVTMLKDSLTCAGYGLDTANIIGIFIPNTYELYWNIPVKKFLDRMKKESDTFWTEQRLSKAENAGMTPQEVITLASIIDEETANNGEKPMIAGMYLNRLKSGMPLQADPTVKFALRQFGLKRIYNNLLNTDSPYNTYRNVGLPPGPIRVASVAGIDAVLNYVKHEYMYMCAKEDFSGTHNFARTYSEHLQNARKYSNALNERGIR